MFNKEEVEVITPRPFERVDGSFILSGFVPKSWLRTDYDRLDERIFLDFLDINGQTFMGISFDLHIGVWSKLTNKIKFSTVVSFTENNAHFISISQGCVNVKISGRKNEQFFYLPVIVKQLEPKEGIDSDILDKHRKVGEMVEQYEKDIKDYNKKLEEIRKRRQVKDNISEDEKSNNYTYSKNLDIANSIFKILDESDDVFEGYLYSQEDKEERELEEKYKDAIEWRGPLFHGIVAMWKGFEMRVYSNDHDSHFHVIHNGKGINARFSFPDFELINYKKNINTISSKDMKGIRALCLQPDNFKKLKNEIERRPNKF